MAAILSQNGQIGNLIPSLSIPLEALGLVVWW